MSELTPTTSSRYSATAPALLAPALVIGGGLAGCVAARALADAGHAVTVLEKSRGLGGRMATRRATLAMPDGQETSVHFDHGTPAFTARNRGFDQAVQQAVAQGWVAPWSTPLAEGSYRDLDTVTRWVARPDLPAWCRALASAPAVATASADAGTGPVSVLASHRVDRLERQDGQWQVHGVGPSDAPFVHAAPLLLLTAPAPQSATLLTPHRPEWAARARSVPMQPTWTLMAVASVADPGSLPPWGLARPQRGPLAWVIRQDTRPGRAALPGAVAFVAHATVEWSVTHLEAETERVQAALLDALAAWTGPMRWHHATVHRWRYATVERAAAQQPGLGLFDPATGLAVAGDWLGGGGVEGAWLSGRAMAAALLSQSPTAA